MGWKYYFLQVHTGKSFVDVWSLFHLSFWLFISSCVWKKTGFNRLFMLGMGMCLAFGWEIFERKAEVWWPQRWLSPESWVNSWISDPLMCVLGMFIGWYALDHWRKE